MEILDCNKNIRCELGVCKNRATREIKFDRGGIRGRIHLCEKCLGELYSAIGEIIVPKSVETAKKKSKAADDATIPALDETVKSAEKRVKGGAKR